ncbi:MAG: SURF1 family protein [Gammaproteobacteria bacterium]
MQIRLGKSFRAGVWPTLAMLLLCALFAWLAVWQWDRAGYKQQLLAQYQAQGKRTPVPLAALLQDPTLESFPPYLRVSAAGSYDSGHQILLQDMTHDGEVGYEVLTPFLMQGGVTALVDRGWVAADEKGGAPDVSIATAPRDILASIGLLPQPGLRLGQPAPPSKEWPKLMFYPNFRDIQPFFGPKLMTPVLHLEPGQPDGYLRETTLDVGLPPSRHLGYAFQWAALAIAVFAVWLVVNLRSSRRKQGAET